MKTQVRFTLNGHPVSAEVEPRLHLGDFLREHRNLTATHLGCEHGVCGACTILIGGNPARACITLTVALEDAEVLTLEGLAGDPRMSIVKDAFHREHGLQCGFCTPGMLISVWDLLRRKPGATDREIREEMSGNLCRCTGYQGIVRSIRRAADELSSEPIPAFASTFSTPELMPESKGPGATSSLGGAFEFDI